MYSAALSRVQNLVLITYNTDMLSEKYSNKVTVCFSAGTITPDNVSQIEDGLKNNQSLITEDNGE